MPWFGVFVTGMAHSIVKGSAYEPTPWRAVQRAAWEALGPSLTMPQAPSNASESESPGAAHRTLTTAQYCSRCPPKPSRTRSS